MTSCKGAAKIGQGARPLVEDGPKTRAGCVAINDEGLVEIWKMQNWCGGQCVFEGLKRRCCFIRPSKAILPEQGSERRSDRPIVLNKSPVVPGEAEKSTKSSRRTRLRPAGHGRNLVAIHGNAVCQNDVAQIGHGRRSEGALGTLQPELVIGGPRAPDSYVRDGTTTTGCRSRCHQKTPIRTYGGTGATRCSSKPGTWREH